MHINQLTESRFLKKEDCGPQGILVTIKTISQENVAKEGVPEELRWAICFEELESRPTNPSGCEELEKPRVLNSTNGQLIAAITGKTDTDDWPGYKVVLYNDPTVSFAGKITGGIRVRAPKGRAAEANKNVQRPAPKPAPGPAQVACDETGEVADDDVPF